MDIQLFGFKFRLEILIFIFVLCILLSGHLLCSCCKIGGFSEGFTPANTNFGESSSYMLGAKPTGMDTWGTPNMMVTPGTATWGMPNLVVTKGEPLSQGVQNILNRPQGEIPLPEGQLLMFANTTFKPECCPNAYSNSSGCACMSIPEYNYLINRGGNNVPYSEY